MKAKVEVPPPVEPEPLTETETDTPPQEDSLPSSSDVPDGPEGSPSGTGWGAVNGTLGPGGTGCPPGELCDGDVIEISSRRVVPKRQVRPAYPAAARALGLGEVRCSVEFTIDERGQPMQLGISQTCPTVFHDSIREAGMRWRFYPARDDQGRPAPARFTLSLIFRLN